MSTLGHKKAACKRGHVAPIRNKAGACVECVSLAQRERYSEKRSDLIAKANAYNRAHPEERRDTQRAWRMGVPVEQIRAAIAESGMKCECCGKQLTHATLCVDHDHSTGRIRGVLCRFCNALEGMLNKQPARVLNLLSYLERKSIAVDALLKRAIEKHCSSPTLAELRDAEVIEQPRLARDWLAQVEAKEGGHG